MSTYISPEKYEQLHSRMSALGIGETDLVEKFIKGSGSGGQKVNKTASCVYLKHHPSGIEVKCQKTRSREANRFFARRELCDRIEMKQLGKDSPQAKRIEKLRKQKARRKRRGRLGSEE